MMLISNIGTLVRVPVSEISVIGRNTQGVRLIQLSEGEKLVSLERIVNIKGEEKRMIFQKEPVITIDGASGTGKGTVSQIIAKRLGWEFLDSGALYRVLALAAQKHSVALDNEKALEVLGEHLDVQFIAQESTSSQIILEGGIRH